MLEFLKGLVTSKSPEGGISHTSFWSNIGMLAMTIVFCYYGYKEILTEWMMWVYAAVVAAPQLISKLISLKWGINTEVSISTDSEKSQNKDNQRSD